MPSRRPTNPSPANKSRYTPPDLDRRQLPSPSIRQRHLLSLPKPRTRLHYSSRITSPHPIDSSAPEPLILHLRRYTPPHPESGGLFNYLFCYSYAQNEKQLEKETQDWSSLDKLGEETVTLHAGSPSTIICSKVGKKFTELRDRIR